MKFKLKHPYQLDPKNGVDIADDVVRMRWSSENPVFSRNTFVTMKIKGGKNKVYRILKGASTEKIYSSEALVSYSTFKQLQAEENTEIQIVKSNFWERNFLFYFNNPDPRLRHKAVRDFLVSFAAFVVSIIEILQFFGTQF